MSDAELATLSDIVTDVHARTQANFSDINPVVSVRRNMRTTGIPADAMTIDCLITGKRIILILHDQMPGVVSYQFSYIEQEAGDQFERMPFSELTADVLYQWISEYFSDTGMQS
jgi:hypothetical protein